MPTGPPNYTEVGIATWALDSWDFDDQAFAAAPGHFCVRCSYRQCGAGRRLYLEDYSKPVVSDESECVVLMLLPFHHLRERSIHPSVLPAPGPTWLEAPRPTMPSWPI